MTEADGDVIGYGYDLDGNRTSLTYPDGTTVAYTYDPVGRLASVSHPTYGTTSYNYDADSRLISESLPDGNSRTWTYTDGRLTGYADSQLGTSTLTRDAAGRITSISGPEDWTYVYDPAGQLTQATRDGRTWAYTYDAVGNITQTDDSVDGQTTFNVNAANQLTTGTDPDGPTTFAYDDAGRLTSHTAGDGTVTTWTYDARGLPAEIVTVTGDGGDDAPGCGDLAFTITGTEDDDVIVGTEGDDIIAGLGGNDTIDGLGGNDIICGHKGADVITGGDGDDLIFGGRGHDELRGNKGADVIRGRRGNDTILGGKGADEIHGGPGDDIIDGGNGHDLIFAGSGTDDLSGGDGDDELHARKGPDSLQGNEGNDLLFGGRGADELRGGKGADELHGRRGADTLYGGNGDDTLDGGKGINDTLDGGSGTDTCDDGETNTACETQTAIGNANNPGPTPAATTTTTETRTHDSSGKLISVGIDDGTAVETAHFSWDTNRPISQIITWTDAADTTSLLYGNTRLGGIDATGGGQTFAYNALGDTIATTNDSIAAADAYGPYGSPEDSTSTIGYGYGYRGELHLGNQVFLRARDLIPSTGRFTSPDMVDGTPGAASEATRYSYVAGDPVNFIDPEGLFGIPGTSWCVDIADPNCNSIKDAVKEEFPEETQAIANVAGGYLKGFGLGNGDLLLIALPGDLEGNVRWDANETQIGSILGAGTQLLLVPASPGVAGFLAGAGTVSAGTTILRTCFDGSLAPVVDAECITQGLIGAATISLSLVPIKGQFAPLEEPFNALTGVLGSVASQMASFIAELDRASRPQPDQSPSVQADGKAPSASKRDRPVDAQVRGPY